MKRSPGCLARPRPGEPGNRCSRRAWSPRIKLHCAIILLVGALGSCSASSGRSADASRRLKCDTWEDVIAADEWQRTVYLVQEGCSGLSNGLNVSIDLALPDGKRTTVLAFADGSWDLRYAGKASPIVTWTGKNRLDITIGAVGAIFRKVDRVGDIEIAFRIEHVLDEEPPPADTAQSG